ncbi:hypothetical protein [Solirubrobacter soli]|uniref:hypothetical protein n=1 Tax=Solirubrobacter soli TaxID=363832 RepID=UPI00040EBC96|nr:hypothetical protein [Solirubrobacter soli]
MKRFLTIVAATAVAAAITIPAVADSGSPSDELATFATCMRAHGVAIPADLEGVAIKQWIGDHQDAAGMQDAFKACDPNPRQGDKADNASPEELVACLRAKGLQPPANVNDLKPWVLQQFETDAGKTALNACGLAAPGEKPAEDGPCGGPDKAKASRAGRAKSSRTHTLTTTVPAA